MKTLSKMEFFTIIWHEGAGDYSNLILKKWADVDAVFNKFYKDHMKDGGAGSCKVKIRVQWENGKEIVDRLDVGNHDWNPQSWKTVGNYLSQFNSTMYGGNLNVGDRVFLSFSDNDSQPENSPKNSPKQPKTARKQPASPPASQPKNSPKITVKSAKISRKQPPDVPTYQPAPETPKNSPKTAQKQPVFNLCFQHIVEMQADTYLLN